MLRYELCNLSNFHLMKQKLNNKKTDNGLQRLQWAVIDRRRRQFLDMKIESYLTPWCRGFFEKLVITRNSLLLWNTKIQHYV